MPICAYCGNDLVMTREHVIPNWYSKSTGPDQIDVFNARKPTKHLKGDMVIKDVCRDCNGGRLSELDSYGHQLYLQFFNRPLFCGDQVRFSADYEKLRRWLLKLSFNSARVHRADTTILEKYTEYILGQVSLHFHFPLYVQLISASDFGTSPPSAAIRLASDAEDVIAPEWFRITQYRPIPELQCNIVQRQVYIDSYCFTLFATDPENNLHVELLERLESAHQNEFACTRIIPRNGDITLEADETHATATLSHTLAHYPNRFGGIQESDDPELAAAATKLVDEEIGGVAIRISREEILTGNTESITERLSELVSTRESAHSAMQRVMLCADGFDDDPRELFQIAESRRFFSRLLDEWPQIAFLAAPPTIKLLFGCCCFPQDAHATGPIFPESDDIDAFLSKGFDGLNIVTQSLALSIELNKQLSEDFVAALESMNQPPAKQRD